MKTITRSNICLPMAAMILTAALAVPAAAEKPVPFEGALRGTDKDIGGPDTAFVYDTSGTGIGTPVGEFSFTQEATINIDTGAETGSAHWIAANGDSIYTTIAGSAYFLASVGLLRITDIHTITGGTGRFAGAPRGFTLDRLASPPPGAPGRPAFFTFGSFHGSIIAPGAAH